MPPFRSGLKRKPDNATTKATASISSSSKLEDEPQDDLLKSVLGEDVDNTDSEPDDESDSEDLIEPVMFGDDDSTLGNDESDVAGSSDEENHQDDSSDLTDSEEEDSDESASEKNSEASDIESGIGQTLSDSSDIDKNTKTKKLSKISPSKNNDIESDEAETKKLSSKVRQKVKKKASKKDGTDSIARLNEQIASASIGNEKDEYGSGDSSDEEDRRNTVGSVPMWWYNDYPHIGYNLDGKKILKPPQRDQIEEFLKKCEDPDFWRTVKDPQTGQDVVLSREDLELLQRIKEGRAPNAQHEEYEPWVDWFTSEVLKTPLRAFPEHKRSFLPSKSEEKKISKIVHALKMGWTKTRKELAGERRKKQERQFYMLWGNDNEDEMKLRGIHKHIPAPKRPPPTHAESYNPPPEYLLDNQEMREWNKLERTPWKRKYTFLPTKHKSLREVPAYERYIRERFLRCLDLYLAPRAIKMRVS